MGLTVSELKEKQCVSLFPSHRSKTKVRSKLSSECMNISLMTRRIIAKGFCLQSRGAIMSLFGTVTCVLMVRGGSAGQAQLIGADWRGVRQTPWIHLHQEEARQWEYVNGWSRMSQLLCGNFWKGVNYLEGLMIGRESVQNSLSEEAKRRNM